MARRDGDGAGSVHFNAESCALPNVGDVPARLERYRKLWPRFLLLYRPHAYASTYSTRMIILSPGRMRLTGRDLSLAFYERDKTRRG